MNSRCHVTISVYILLSLLSKVTPEMPFISVLHRTYMVEVMSGCRDVLLSGKDKVTITGRIFVNNSTWKHRNIFGFDVYSMGKLVTMCKGYWKDCCKNQQTQECYCSALNQGYIYVTYNKTVQEYMNDCVVVLWWGLRYYYVSNALPFKEKIIGRYDSYYCGPYRSKIAGRSSRLNGAWGVGGTVVFCIFITTLLLQKQVF